MCDKVSDEIKAGHVMCDSDKAGDDIIKMEHIGNETIFVVENEIQESGSVPPVDTTLYLPNTDCYVDIGEKRRTRKDHKQKREKRDMKDINPFKPSNVIVYMAGPSPENYNSDPLDYEPGERSTFIIVVLGLVLVMVLITIGVVAMVTNVQSLRDQVLRFSLLLFIVGLVLYMIAYYGMACYGYGRVLPCNIILLLMGFAGTLMLMSVVAVIYAPKILLIALAITAVIILLCFILAFTSIDFTGYLIVVIVAIIVLLLVSFSLSVICFLLKIRLPLVQIVLCALIAIVYSVMVIIELQMVLGGNTYEYGENDYAFAAFSVYTSFVTLFLRIVKLLSYIAEYLDLDWND